MWDNNSYTAGLHVDKYSMIILFQSEEDMAYTLSANPHMEAMTSSSDKYLSEHFPGVFIAGMIRGEFLDKQESQK